MATLGWLQIAAVDHSLKLEIDWEKGELRSSAGNGKRKYLLSDLTALVVRGLYHTRITKGSSSRSGSERVYRSRLSAQIDEDEISIVTTDSEQRSVEQANSQLTPFATELAEALDVELREEAEVKQSHQGLLASIGNAPLWLSAFFFLQLIGAGSFLVWRAQPALEISRMHQEVEQRGGSTSETKLVIADRDHDTVSGIHFGETSVKDEDLIGLRETFSKWEPFTLELYETNITDKALQAIAGNEQLLSINLRHTQITDEGVQSLVNCQSLLEVNLNRTSVSDKAISQLAQLPNLKSLHLWGTRVSDACLPELAKLNGLEEIYLNETRVTPEGLNQLREQLPNTKIHH